MIVELFATFARVQLASNCLLCFSFRYYYLQSFLILSLASNESIHRRGEIIKDKVRCCGSWYFLICMLRLYLCTALLFA